MKKTNLLLIISAILLILLALISMGYAAWQNFGMNPMLNRAGQNLPEGFPSRPADGFQPSDRQFPLGQDGSQMTPPSDFQGRMPQGGDTNFPSGFNGSRSGFGLLRWVGIVLYGVALILTIVTAVFLMKGKKWAAISAIILAAALAIASISTFLGRNTTLSILIGIIRVALGVGVIVLLLLPKSRAIWNHPQIKIDDDDDDDDDEDDDNDEEPVVSQTAG